MTKPNEIIIKNIIKASDDMVHSFFFYPVRGGSQFIVDRLAESTTIKNEKVSSISHSGKGFIINQDDQSVYSSIVFTGSIRDLASIIDEDTIKALELNLLNNYEQEALDFNGTSNLLCECDENDYSWIYLPEPNTKFHRIIMTGNFSPNNNSPTLPKNRTTCTVEVSGYCKREDMEQSITSLPFNLKPIAYNYCENSYIIHNHKTKSLVSRLTSQLENKGIYCCGRFAEWKYYNMDAAIASAMQVTAKIHSRGVFQ